MDAAGAVTAAAAEGWPLASLVATAHEKGAQMWVGVKTPSKSASASFLRLPKTVLRASAEALAGLVADANYDGFQVDFEGLKPESKLGYEYFLAASAEAADARGLHMSSTLYARCSRAMRTPKPKRRTCVTPRLHWRPLPHGL